MLSSPTSFSRNALRGPQVPSRDLRRPRRCLQQGLPCVEERSLHSYGDGIEQIPTTFQQLRETGSGGAEAVSIISHLKYYPNESMLVPKKYGPSVYTDQKARLLGRLTAPHRLFTLTAGAACCPSCGTAAQRPQAVWSS